jgi:hypothetical protein
MAANTHLTTASWDLALNAALDVLNGGGFLEIYDSTGAGQPATPNVVVTTQVKLAKLTLASTAFGASSGGTKTAGAIGSVAALATGTATWFRAFKSDDTTAVIDGSCGTSGTDLILNDVAITSGGTVSCSSWTVSMPAGQ